MKKNWLVKTVLVILVLGVLAVGGFALYQIGYVHGVQASATGEMPLLWAEQFENMPHADYWRSGNDGNWMMPAGGRTPYSSYGSWMMDGYSRTPFNSHMSYGMGGFFFLPFFFRVLLWGFLVWLAYKLVTGFKSGRGWHFSLTRDQAAPVVEEVADEA